jgi:uncharacterized membrane protein
MSFTSVTKTIEAPKDLVFATVSDIQNFSKAVPHILEVEFLTEQKTGLGARFRETRDMNGRKESTELEVTEFVENERIRMVSDAGGTIWDTLFSVSGDGDTTRLDVEMDARPHKFLARLMTPLIRRMVSKAVEKDIDAVKAYCESR